MRGLTLLLVCALCLCAQQAAVEGVVVDAVTGQPLDRVHVRLLTFGFNGPGDVLYGAISDRAGHFSVGTVQPGTYILMPTRAGFVAAQKKTDPPIPTVTLKAGQRLADFRIEMTRRAVIMGRVLDEYGDPVQNVQVEAVPVPPDTPRPNIVGRGDNSTNERGEFRIAGAPGKYHIKASPRAFFGGGGGSRSEEPAYGTTYFPNAPSADRASPVEAKAGEDLTGIDIRLTRQQVLSISGMVKGLPDDGSLAMVTLRWGDNANELRSASSTMAGPDGRFTFSRLQPGFYRIFAGYSGGKTSLQSQMQDLRLEGGGAANVELTLAPGGELRGTLQVDGESPGAPPAVKRTVRLSPSATMYSITGVAPSGDVEKDGSFRVAGVHPGKYTVQVEPMPDNGYLKSVLLDGKTVPANALDFSQGASGGALSIAIARNAAQVSGIVQDKDGQPFANHPAAVFLVRNPNEIAVTDITRVGTDARYEIKGIAPGRYRLFAIDAFRHTGSRGADVFKELAAAAEEIELKEGDKLIRNLTPIEKEATDAKPKQ